MTIKEDAYEIIQEAIHAVLPDEAVKKALVRKQFSNGNIVVVAVGKAAWQMAKAASNILKDRIQKGIVVTKYGHVKGNIKNIECWEAGHPILDENTYQATQRVLELVSNLHKEDTVLFLLSGGGSALFEKSLISLKEMQDISSQLLACGANICEINTIRKRLSSIKGGKFAQICEPAQVYSIVLSDIIGDPLDMIASGPAYPDSSTSKEAKEIIKKYHIHISKKADELLDIETPKELHNVKTVVTGSVRQLCQAVMKKSQELGYEPILLTDQLCGEAKEMGSFLSSIAKTHQNDGKSLAYIAGGETVVHLMGKGKGGRNQELALSSCVGISNLKDTCIFSFGSDGTDGPTDAAGGFVDQDTFQILQDQGINVFDVLKENDSYHALEKCDGLIQTGPTGTNVNDVAVVLIKR